MKYGIDIDSEKILNFISERLKERGHFIIDLTEKNSINNGRSLLKKVLIANVTNIDLYFSINFKEEIFIGKILFSNDNFSKILGEELLKLIDNNFENIICENGSYLYLIKNINSSVVYGDFPMEYKERIEDILVTNRLIDILEIEKND